MYQFSIQVTTFVCVHVSMYSGGEAAKVKTTDGDTVRRTEHIFSKGLKMWGRFSLKTTSLRTLIYS